MVKRAGETRTEIVARNLFLVGILVFMSAPVVLVIINSFNVSSFNAWPPTGWTLDWYRKAIAYPPFRKGFVNSSVVAFCTTLFVLIVATPAAYALARKSFPGKALLRSAILGPLVVPRVAIGFALFILFLVLSLPLYGSRGGMVVAHTIICLPLAVTILIANFSQIDPSLAEAARDLGAGPVRAFWSAILPQIRGGLAVAAAFTFIMSFDEVEATLFLTTPAINTLPIEMYHYLEYQQEPMIAAVSTILILLSLVVVILAMVVWGRTSRMTSR